MRLNNGFGQRKAEPHALCILGKAAAVEALENVGQVFRMNPATGIPHPDLHHRRKGAPLDLNGIACPCVIQCIFDQVAQSLAHPVSITEENHVFVARKAKLLALLFCLNRKPLFQRLHQIRQILLRLFH